MISQPKCAVKRWPISAGSASPADEHSRSATSARCGSAARRACGVACRRAEEHRWPLLQPAAEGGLGRGPLGHQHHGGADAEREAEAVAQPVGEIQLGRREADILLLQAEHRAGIERRGPVRVAVAVHHALGLAGRAGRVKPEAGIVATGGGRRLQRRLRGKHRIQRRHAIGQRLARTRYQDLPDFMPGTCQRLLQHGQQRGRHQHRLRAAVLQHVAIVVGGQQRVDGHRDDAGVHRAQEADWPVGAVVHQQQHALFAVDAGAEQRGSQAPHPLRQFAIGELAVVIDIGHLAGAPGIAAEQVLGKVEGRAGWPDGCLCGRGGHGCLPVAGVRCAARRHAGVAAR